MAFITQMEMWRSKVGVITPSSLPLHHCSPATGNFQSPPCCCCCCCCCCFSKVLSKCQCSALLHQGVVTYMSRVEAFATRIKIQSSDQSPFWEPIKGSRLPPNCDNQMIKNRDSDSTFKIKQSRAFEGMIKWSSTLFAYQRSWSWSQMLQQATYSDYPLFTGMTQ